MLIISGGQLWDQWMDTMLNLFDSIVSPIMLYGCELWGYSNIDVLERLHVRFCKILLKVLKKHS